MSSNPSLGDDQGKDAKPPEIQEGFFSTGTVPNTLLTENFPSRWRCQALPKRRGTRIQRYAVLNVNTNDVVWIGRDRLFGNTLAQRIAGWQEAALFPPPPVEIGPAIRDKPMPLCQDCGRNEVQFEDEDTCSWCMEKARGEDGE